MRVYDSAANVIETREHAGEFGADGAAGADDEDLGHDDGS